MQQQVVLPDSDWGKLIKFLDRTIFGWGPIVVFVGVIIAFTVKHQPTDDGWLSSLWDGIVVTAVVAVGVIIAYIVVMAIIAKKDTGKTRVLSTLLDSFKDVTGSKEADVSRLEGWKNKSLAGVLTIGAIGFFYFGTLWLLLIGLLLRALTLPPTPAGLRFMWLDIIMILIFGLFPGTQDYVVGNYKDIAEVTKQAGCEAIHTCKASVIETKKPTVVPSTTATVTLPLGVAWTEIKFVPNKLNLLYCDKPGAMEQVTYEGYDPDATIGRSGSVMPCPTFNDKKLSTGRLSNVKFYVRSELPGINAVHRATTLPEKPY